MYTHTQVARVYARVYVCACADHVYICIRDSVCACAKLTRAIMLTVVALPATSIKNAICITSSRDRCPGFIYSIASDACITYTTIVQSHCSISRQSHANSTPLQLKIYLLGYGILHACKVHEIAPTVHVDVMRSAPAHA
jgi:hypothetical protein